MGVDQILAINKGKYCWWMALAKHANNMKSPKILFNMATKLFAELIIVRQINSYCPTVHVKPVLLVILFLLINTTASKLSVSEMRKNFQMVLVFVLSILENCPLVYAVIPAVTERKFLLRDIVLNVLDITGEQTPG